MFSEYMLSTVAQVIFEQDVIRVPVPTLDSSMIDAFVQEYQDNFGDHEDIPLVIKSVTGVEKYKPVVRITKNVVYMDFYMTIHIPNPFRLDWDAAVIVVKVTTETSLSIDQNFQMVGIMKDLKMEAVEFKPYFMATDTTLKTLTTALQRTLFAGYIESYFNNILDDGFDLPILSELKFYIKNISISTYDGLLLIQGQTNEPVDEPVLATMLSRRLNEKQHFSTTDRAMATDRFYSHVDKVHALKIERGEASNEKSDDVFETVDQIMQDEKEVLKYDQWPEPLQR